MTGKFNDSPYEDARAVKLSNYNLSIIKEYVHIFFALQAEQIFNISQVRRIVSIDSFNNSMDIIFCHCRFGYDIFRLFQLPYQV